MPPMTFQFNLPSSRPRRTPITSGRDVDPDVQGFSPALRAALTSVSGALFFVSWAIGQIAADHARLSAHLRLAHQRRRTPDA
jgi:hypothetical protein